MMYFYKYQIFSKQTEIESSHSIYLHRNILAIVVCFQQKVVQFDAFLQIKVYWLHTNEELNRGI